MDEDGIPESYVEIVKKNIVSENVYQLGKIKYDDKILVIERLLKDKLNIQSIDTEIEMLDEMSNLSRTNKNFKFRIYS